MLFNFELVVKVNNITKYRIGGSLTPEEGDKELFEQVKDAYKEIIDNNSIDFLNHLIIKDDYILFVDIDIITMSNILKLLGKNLRIDIKPNVVPDCKFQPAACEPLFKMEIHRLFR